MNRQVIPLPTRAANVWAWTQFVLSAVGAAVLGVAICRMLGVH